MIQPRQSLFALALVHLVAAGLAAQCAYPSTPRAGFPITERLDVPITFRDGARTRMDIYHPTQRIPCGWPVLFYMHGMGHPRRLNRDSGRRLARRGYACVIFDVRGQGDAIALNGGQHGFKYVGDTERLDIVEVVQFLGANFRLDADVRRLGMLGFSQGAMYCWAAAAWSGRTLPANPRGLTRFPEFRAICPFWWAPLTGAVIAPEGKAFANRLFTVLYEFPNEVKIDPAWRNRVEQAFRSQDFAAVARMFDADPFRQEAQLLKTSKVPVFTQVSWNDDWVPLSALLDVFAGMPPATPKRSFLTFPGHDGPRHVKPMQSEILKIHSDRWMDRFLKDDHNGVEFEAPVIAGAVNQTDAEFRGWNPVWNRYHAAWPPAARRTRTYYLRQGNALAERPPTGAEPADLVRHVIPANYGVADYIRGHGHVFNTLRRIPRSSIAFDTPPLRDDFEIVGQAQVAVEVDPTGKNYQLHCALYRVEPNGTELFLASGVALRRQATASAARLAVTMNHVDAIVRAGQRLRLRLENLTFRPAVDTPNLMVAPYFESVDVRVQHTVTAAAARISTIAIPYVPFVAPALLASHIELDVATQPVADVLLRVKAPTYPRSEPYVIVFGGAGMSPGYRWAGRHVHMNWDPVVSNTMLQLLNTPLIPFSLGTLGGQLQSSPRLSLEALGPLPPAAAGFRLIAVAALGDGNVTNPVEILLR